MPNNLTKKQQLFIFEYLKQGNGTKAVIAAGYSEHGAAAAGTRLLKNVKVSAEISREREKLCEELHISAKRVLNGLATLAFFDIRKFYRENGSLKSVPELDDQTQAALCGMKIEKLYEHCGEGRAQQKGTLTKIKVADRGRNLERLGRHLKLFTDRVEHNGTMHLAELIAKGRKRVAEQEAAQAAARRKSS
jgi:phage terminase small subunit